MKKISPSLTKTEKRRSRVINLNAIPAGPSQPSHASIRETQRHWIAPAIEDDWNLIRRLHQQ